MLRIIAFIQCDMCNGVLNQIAVAGDPRREAGENSDALVSVQLHELRLSAEERGWQSAKDSTVHYCSSCTHG